MTRYIDLSGDSRFDPYVVNPGKLGRPRKYGNQKTVTGGMEFDSRKEADRWDELRLLQRGRIIKDLERQVKFVLIPAQYENGKLIERAVTYIADFVYTDAKTGEKVVEDTKGMRTKEYILKRKMMLYFHGIRIKEV